MKSLAAATFVCCLTVSAQQITMTTASNPDGRLRVNLTNHTPATLTAFFATWPLQDLRPGHLVFHYSDSFIGAYHPIPSGGTGNFNVEVTAPQIHAALFDDGTTYGDPDWVAVLLRRRGGYLNAIDAGIRDLQAALKENLSREAIARQLTASQEAQLAAHTPKIPLPNADIKQIFAEPDAAMKAANLSLILENEMRFGILAVYPILIRNIQKVPDPQTLITQLESKKPALLSSKPVPIR